MQDVGVFNQKAESRTPQEMMMSNPDMMMNMMKGNLTGFLPQARRVSHALLHLFSSHFPTFSWAWCPRC